MFDRSISQVLITRISQNRDSDLSLYCESESLVSMHWQIFQCVLIGQFPIGSPRKSGGIGNKQWRQGILLRSCDTTVTSRLAGSQECLDNWTKDNCFVEGFRVLVWAWPKSPVRL